MHIALIWIPSPSAASPWTSSHTRYPYEIGGPAGATVSAPTRIKLRNEQGRFFGIIRV